MTAKFKNNILSVLLAIFCGFIAGNLFLRFYGIIVSYLTDINAIVLIKIFPVSIRGNAYSLYCFIFEVIALAIVIFFTGCTFGAFLKIGRFKATIISFTCYQLTKAFHHYQVWNEFSLTNSLIIYFLIISVITFLFFWCSFYLGEILLKRIY